ncbi:hypothetical protein Ahy_B08g091024 [Arachis hypogaea]|uniref:Ubiquitin-like protease family profile domain-containing protein n=1 Tax=Arachis hypogaea TaxID=3818 RepID=A0A444Y179_ARAHY|nr:hypothetical protein Ahy_B08g091024 [Arachis hypogaea]
MRKQPWRRKNSRTRLSSSLRLNWSLNVEMLPGAFLILAFNFQFKANVHLQRVVIPVGRSSPTADISCAPQGVAPVGRSSPTESCDSYKPKFTYRGAISVSQSSLIEKFHVLDAKHKKSPSKVRTELNKFVGFMVSKIRVFAGGEPLMDKDERVEAPYVNIAAQRISYNCAIYVMKCLEIINPKKIKREKYEWKN